MRVCSECRTIYEDEVLTCTDESHPTLSDLRDGSREMIPGYRLVNVLSSSVNDSLFRALRLDCGRSCLIRIFRSDAAALREAQLAASLFHPGIVDIYEAGRLESGEVFVVTEDLEGKTLRDVLSNVGRPALLTSIEIILQTAEALQALHLKGLSHGAIRPENIILTTDPGKRLLVRIQNIDFGGFVEHSILSNKFMIDTAIDSLKYFASEQCSGNGRSVKADIYSLGIVFYELLAGVTPFHSAKAAGLIEMHKSQRPADIRIDDFDLRMLVTHSVMEALQKQPDKRQASADALARQMRHIRQLATHVSTPPPAGVVPSPPARPQNALAVELIAGAPATLASSVERSVTYDEVAQPAVLRQVRPDGLGDGETGAPETVGLGDGGPAVADLGTEGGHPGSNRSRLRLLRKRRQIKVQTTATDAIIDLSMPKTDETSVSPNDAQFATVVPTYSKIEWDQPEDDIPSLEEVREVLSKEPLSDTAAEPYVGRLVLSSDVIITDREIQAASNEVSTPVPFADDEEITIVTARPAATAVAERTSRAVRRQAGEYAGAQRIEDQPFFPTILGGFSETRPPAAETGNPIFSSYSPRRSSVPYRALIVGGGVVLLVGLFVSVSDSLNRYVGAWNRDDAVTAKANPASDKSVPHPVQASPSVPSASNASETIEKAVTTEAATKNSSPKPTRESSTVSSPEEKPQRSATSSNLSDPSLSKPIRLDGKTQSDVKPAEVSRDKKTVAAPVRTEATSRPRIVKNPRP